MKHALMVLMVTCILLGLVAQGWGLVSQQIYPNQVWLSVYQGLNRAWVVEEIALPLEEGENIFFLSRPGILGERFFVRPLAGEAALLSVASAGTAGFRVTVDADDAGFFPFLLASFQEGFDWSEGYAGVINQKANQLTLYPTVFLDNLSSIDHRDVMLSWVLGEPSFIKEPEPYFPEEYDMLMEPAIEAPARAMVPSPPPPVVERLAGYQVFHLPYPVDLPDRKTLAVSPEERSFPLRELYRFQEGRLRRVLVITGKEEPIAGGRVALYPESEGSILWAQLPMLRADEEVEIELVPTSKVTVNRTELVYKRLKAVLNRDREVVAFEASREIEFTVTNNGNRPMEIELVERLPQGARVTSGEQWIWEDHSARYTIPIGPDEEDKILLLYTFREVL